MADTTALIAEMARAARVAARTLSAAPTHAKAEALRSAAQNLRANHETILAANAEDIAAGAANGLSGAMLDRLRLDEGRLESIAAAVEAVAALPDPVGSIINRSVPANGIALERVRVPLGVVGIIYESRPNVTADAAALGLMAGNAVILRGGSEAGDIGEALHEAPVIADDSRYLRLLQHDLGHPDGIGVPRVLPGQVMATVLSLPLDDRSGESGHGQCCFARANRTA